jgi:hypothetical protein
MKPIKSLSNFNQVKQNINTLFKHNVKSDPDYIQRCIDEFHKVEKSNGTRAAVGNAKEHLRLVSRFIMRQSTERQLGPMWIKTSKDGLPLFLKINASEGKKLRSCPVTSRCLLTTLSYYKQIHLEPDYDVSTIVTPQSSEFCKEAIDEMKAYIPQILSEMGIKKFKKSNDNFMHVTTKAGGHGPKAMGITSLYDMVAVIREGLFPKINELWTKVYTDDQNKKIKRIVNQSINSITLDVFQNIKPSSRLHFISEGGGKTRVICIGDIWSQMAFKPIHDHLMKELGKIPSDGTSSHNNLATKLRSWTDEEQFYCFDLKAATDRMPALLQKEIFQYIFGKDIADLWFSLITDRDVGFRDSTVRYAVGQPMGFLSSWPSMAITHHFIINFAFHKSRVSPKDRKYGVIGDDMAINNSLAASEYLECLKKLGMNISIEKSILPNKSKQIRSAEIAKRYFINGNEISPITPKLICLATSSLDDLLALRQTLFERSYFLPPLQESENQNETTKHSPGPLDVDSFTISFLKKMKKKEIFPACAYLSSPLYENTNSTFSRTIPFAPISRMTSEFWATQYGLIHRWEQHLLLLLANRIIKYEENLKKAQRTYDFAVNKTARDFSPLVTQYFINSKEEIKKVIAVYNTSYEDEEGDSDDLLDQTDPSYVMEKLLTKPNPMDRPLFQGGQILRVKLKQRIITSFILDQFPKGKGEEYWFK